MKHRSIDKLLSQKLTPLFILFTFISCNIKDQFNIYKEQTDAIEFAMEELITMRPKGELIQDWNYSEIDSAFLKPSDSIIYEKINLPHKKEIPNSKMFYYTKVHFNENKLLKVNADDGAQVFFKGQQVFQSQPELYSLPATEDSVTLKIVVFNNAMSGGLKKAEVMNYKLGMNY